MTTYRIEQRSREGQILRAEWVDEDGTAYSLRQALQDVAHMRAISPNFEWRVSGADGELVDEIAALDATDPARIANRWLRATGHSDVVVKSGEQIAACLWLAADRLEKIGEIHETSMRLVFQPSQSRPEEPMAAAAVDAIAAAVGTYAGPVEMSRGSWQHTTNHRPDSITSVQAYVGIPAPVDEPAVPELVDGREDPETGDPVPDGVEGHPVGRVVEQTARAILQPDTLPDDREPEKACHCGTPWALIISGHASHADDCAGEAGEAEDALGESEGTR